jgi:hypothetical protein
MADLNSIVPAWNIEIMRGDGSVFRFTITESGSVTPVDLTGATLWYSVKKSFTDLDSAAILIKMLGTGIAILDAANGIGTITFTDDDFNAMIGAKNREANYHHDLQIQKSGEQPHTCFNGRLTVLPDVSNQKL